MKKVIFATGNAGKMREIKMILEDLRIDEEPVRVLSMKEAGINVEIIEDGETFVENATIKAKTVAEAAKELAQAEGSVKEPKKESARVKNTDYIVLADDSGHEIDYLNKEPGIYSARYLGEDTPYSEKNQNLIDRLVGVPDTERTARFVCAIAAVLPDGKVLTSLETIEGRIGYEERGDHGFGYDPIFMVPAYGKSTAELTEEEKNEISHRGKALRAMKMQLQNYFISK